MYDLIVMPITLKDGRQVAPGPGLKVVAAPRRAARSRAEDVLILSLTVSDHDRFSLQTQESWLDDLVQSFFKTSGSVTTALRMLIESINLTMLEQNLKLAREGKTATGAINLMAIHRQAVYVAQSGSTHAYVLSHQELQHFFDMNQADRGLGLSRTPTIRYFQADLGEGAFVFLTETPPDSWTEERLFSGEFPSREQLCRRLLNQAPANFRLNLIEIQPGEGKIETVQTATQPSQTVDVVEPLEDIEKETVQAPEQVIESPALDETVDRLEDTQEIKLDEPPATLTSSTLDEPREMGKGQLDLESDVVDEFEDSELSETQHDLEDIEEKAEADESDLFEESEKIEGVEKIEDAEDLIEPKTTLGETDLVKSQSALEPTASAIAQEEPGKTSRERRSRETKARQPKRNLKADFQNFLTGFNHWKNQLSDKVLRGLSGFFKWWHSTREKLGAFFNKLLARSSVGQAGSLQISRGTMLLIAIVVPLIVVLIATGFYLARGRNQQYDYYFEQAQVASANAMAATDPATKRDYWTETLEYLEQAEAVRETNEIKQLRDTALDALDALEGAVRLAYQPAITGVLNEDIVITRMVSYGPDLYLLDATGGRVIHAIQGNQGFEIDLEFTCEPGSYAGGYVDPFVDMVSMPINNPYQAQILAVDASGNIAFCGINQNPIVQKLPSLGLNAAEIKRIAYDINYLYALDPLASNILVYRPANYQFIEPPTLYFEGEDLNEKPDLNQIVDLAVNGSDLYLLRSDGMIVDCRTSGFSENPVTCENPVTYVDGRLGREEQNVIMPESSFNSILYTTPPDPAISLLDATNGDIYRLSLRFRLYQLLRPDLGDFELQSTTATAFTIGSNRFAFIAFGNQVFYAYIE